MVKPMLIRLCDKAAVWFDCVGSHRLSNRKAARYAVRFVVLTAFAGTLAAYSAYAKRTPLATDAFAAQIEPQVSNRAAKTHRLLVAALTIPSNSVYALASADPDAVIKREVADPVKAAAPKIPEAEVAAPVAPPAVAAPKQAVVAPVALPHEKPAEKPKRVAPPVAPQASNGLLDDGQISGLKGRLRLTSDQAEYWPAVEEALREVARTHLRGAMKHGTKLAIDTNSPEVQKLIWAAVPLLMRLREDQKSEVRKLARVIGLEQVASQI